jgi:hypothetical protein
MLTATTIAHASFLRLFIVLSLLLRRATLFKYLPPTEGSGPDGSSCTFLDPIASN